MGMGGFRDRADEALTQGEEEVDLGDQQAHELQQWLGWVASHTFPGSAGGRATPAPSGRVGVECDRGNEPRGCHGGGQDGPARRLTTPALPSPTRA
jgi:hypothetical protein